MRLIRRKGIRKFILIPLSIDVLLVSIAIYFGAQTFESLLNSLLPSGDSLLTHLLKDILWFIFGVLVFVCLFFISTILANLVSAPFNGLLSEKVEETLKGVKPKSEESILRSLASSFASEVKKFAVISAVTIISFLISLIPGVNVAFPLVWFLVTSWIFAVEYISYPLENRGLHFKDARKLVRSRPSLFFGFGAAAFMITSVPLVNFIAMPASVAGATYLYVMSIEGSPGR